MSGLAPQDEVQESSYDEILPVSFKPFGLLVPWLEANIRALNHSLDAQPDPYRAGMLNALAAAYRVATCRGDHDSYLDSDCQMCGWTWSDQEDT